MDELSLRALLERATSPEPPLGHLVGNSLRAGRKLRQRRRATGAAALSAAAIVAVSAVPVLTSGAGPKASKQGPAVVAMPPADARTAYVATNSSTVVPISLATNAAGMPIAVPGPWLGRFAVTAAPNGRTVYEVGNRGVTPIDTATNTARPTITLQPTYTSGFVVAPNGKTAYLGTYRGVYPISTATNTLGKRIKVPDGCSAMAFTLDGKTLYVLSTNVSRGSKTVGTVTPIETATNTVLAPIRLPAPDYAPRYLTPSGAYNIAITPNGKTAYVLYGVQRGAPYANSVIPVSLATNTPHAPIAIQASGLASVLAIAPGGRTAYVLTSRAVTPIDIARNQAEPAINLPESAGYAYDMALTPNGRSLYVLTPRGVIPIRTASRTVLPRINVPKLENFTELAITPDGRTVYVGISSIRRRHGKSVLVAAGVVPISTATNTVGRPVNLGAIPIAITFAR
jgi:hypothetical protein